MPHWKRAHVPGGSFFFTVVTHRRIPIFKNDQAAALLGKIIRECQAKWPFRIDALVLLPEHLHAIWSMPHNDDRYSARWGWIKKEFTKRWLAMGSKNPEVSVGRQRERRLGIWQPRFWEHALESEDDYEAHFDYIHFNPVKHKHVASPRDWNFSSFHRWVKRGVYPADWACGKTAHPEFKNIDNTVGEID